MKKEFDITNPLSADVRELIRNLYHDGCGLQKASEEVCSFVEGDNKNREYYYHYVQACYDSLDAFDNQDIEID